MTRRYRSITLLAKTEGPSVAPAKTPENKIITGGVRPLWGCHYVSASSERTVRELSKERRQGAFSERLISSLLQAWEKAPVE